MMIVRNETTCETCPRHIWMDAVICEVAALGLPVESLAIGGALRSRMNAAYSAGEPVWMMVDEMGLRVRQANLCANGWEESARRVAVRAMTGRNGGAR